jgi:aspartyl-tRNA(Asn)/glutamyl-tRNA(Gln) amidotransferase subunit A
MEQIGVACRNIGAGFEALSAIAGFDGRDGTLAAAGKYVFSAPEDDLKGLKIAVPRGCGESLKCTAERLKAAGAAVETIDFDLHSVPAVAYIITAAETSNSIARFDGIKFGYRTEKYSNLEDIYLKSRTECFTLETKLLTLAGMFVLTKERLDDCYNKALLLRRAIKGASDDVLKEYDAIMTPAERAEGGDAYEAFCGAYKNLKYLALPNLTGDPAIAVPGGVQFMAKAFDENTLFRIGKRFCGKESAR